MSRRLVVACGVLALVIVCIAIAVLVRTAPAEPPQPNPSPTPSPTTTVQQTLLVAVRDDDGEIADAVTLGTNNTTNPVTASWLSMQPGLEVGVDADSILTLAKIGPYAPGDTATIMSNLLGFQAAGAMVLDRLAFAGLVDGVGGVTVNSPEPIVAVDDNGNTTVLVKAGKRKIYGPAAAAYVITLNPGENQAVRMNRFNEVFTQVIQKLPGNPDRVRSIVGSLGSSSRISVAPEYIAELLLEVQTAQNDSTVTQGIPQTTVTGQSATALYLVDPVANQPEIVRLFADSILVPGRNGQFPRVRLIAAGVTNDSVLRVQQTLLNDELTMVWGGEAPSSRRTAIFIPDESAQPLAQQLATALNIPNPVIRVRPKDTVGVQATIRLAKDTPLSSATPTPTPTPTQTMTP